MEICNKCNTEIEEFSKFCTNCGEKVSTDTAKEIVESKGVSLLIKIFNGIVSVIVGFFIFTILKVIFSFMLILLVKINVLSFDNYEGVSTIFIFVSLYFAVKLTQKLNIFKTKKIRIILRVIIIILGVISAVGLTINNSIVRDSYSFNDKPYPMAMVDTLSNKQKIV